MPLNNNKICQQGYMLHYPKLFTKININNLGYADDRFLIANSLQQLKEKIAKFHDEPEGYALN